MKILERSTYGNTVFDGSRKNSNEFSTITARIRLLQKKAFQKDGKGHRRDKSSFHAEIQP